MSELPPLAPRRGFDLTVNLGHILIITFGVCGLIGSHYVSDYRMAALERHAAVIQAKLDNFTTLVIDGAVTAQRLKEFERRLDLAERAR